MPDGNTVPTCDWKGVSGRAYRYWIYPIGASLKAAAGNYVFARRNHLGQWVPVYIGQTGDLAERFDQHHKTPCILRSGATHIHAHLTQGGESVRLAEERDLITMYNPSCNG